MKSSEFGVISAISLTIPVRHAEKFMRNLQIGKEKLEIDQPSLLLMR